MTATAGLILVQRIVPLIAAAVMRGAVRGVGCEDAQELTAEGCAIAAGMLDSAETRGQKVTPGNIAYFTVRRLKSGRRSGYAGRQDVMCPAAALDGSVEVQSIDAPVGVDGEDSGDEFTLHDCIASSAEDTDAAALRRLDWGLVMPRLDDRRRRVLEATAEGIGTGELADELKISAPRVCQLRDSLGPCIAGAWGHTGLSEAGAASKWRHGLRAQAERRAARHERCRA